MYIAQASESAALDFQEFWANIKVEPIRSIQQIPLCDLSPSCYTLLYAPIGDSAVENIIEQVGLDSQNHTLL